jgi:hypothetical protein
MFAAGRPSGGGRQRAPSPKAFAPSACAPLSVSRLGEDVAPTRRHSGRDLSGPRMVSIRSAGKVRLEKGCVGSITVTTSGSGTMTMACSRVRWSHPGGRHHRPPDAPRSRLLSQRDLLAPAPSGPGGPESRRRPAGCRAGSGRREILASQCHRRMRRTKTRHGQFRRRRPPTGRLPRARRLLEAVDDRRAAGRGD